MTTIKLY